MKTLILSIALLTMSGTAYAHPHEDKPKQEKPKAERNWPYFGKSTKAKESSKNEVISETGTKSLSVSDFASLMEKRMEKHSAKMERSLEKAKKNGRMAELDGDIKSADDIRDAARAIEDMISESGMISNLADMVLNLAEDFDVESTDDGVSLNFDGKRMGRIKRSRNNDDSLDIEGFGRNLTIDKKVIRKNGTSKTRIVIEMDGDEDVDIELSPKDN